ncbi:hypothetical protein O181_070709 [Austropuccinia psidii MF-1]|uniref:GAG-pre-integrase domain-containing protein n=1 Tax=Austropuccinia psidii MF-1 TaxID=1389203 RepID=A0A9Q3I9S3_9BASI|nr:hypothetical protein [Austropuccinia psidii MF-1]
MMNEKTLHIKDISNLPSLDGTNYGHWQMRMKIYLRSRELLDVCKKSRINNASTSSSNQWSKASFEAINIITSRITERVFREIINCGTVENSHLLWSKIFEQYASRRAVNQGRVWMDWQCCFFDGNLQNYIDNCKKLMMELDTDFASHNSHSGYTQNKKETSSSALITEYDKPHKIIFYCSQGKHNRQCTTHKKEECWEENPHLRPTQQGKKRKNKPKAHLSIVQALETIRGSIKPMSNWVIVDCGATHHMFNSPKFFSNSFEEIKSEVATGDSQSNLLAHGIGNAELRCNGSILNLKNCLFVPKLKCNLISMLELFKDQLTIKQANNSFFLSSKGEVLLEGEIWNRLMYITYDPPNALPTVVNGNLLHCRLGHPGCAVMRNLGLPDQERPCLTCETNKSHQLPFLYHFEPVRHPLDAIHIDVVGPITPESVSVSCFLLTIVDQPTS